MKDVRKLLDRLETADEAAWAELARLCEGGRFVMRVPVDEARDSDTVLGAGMQMRSLVAALRGVLDLADDLDSYVAARGRTATGSYDDGLNRAQASAAADLRSVVAAALRGESGR